MELFNIDVTERMRHYNVAGLSLALIDKGQICETQHYGILECGTECIVDRQSIFSACSISKFLTSVLALKLVDQGRLDLDEDVNEKLSSWKVPHSALTQDRKVTLRRLLSHQSGIVDPNGFDVINVNVPLSMADVLAGKTAYCSTPVEVEFPPESDFQYSDAGFCVIQQLIEDITESPFETVMSELIFEPLQMKRSTLHMTAEKAKTMDCACGHRENGEVVDERYPIYPYPAACGLWTTPSDLALLVIDLMNSLKGVSQIKLSADMAKEMIRPQGGKEWVGLGVFLDGSQEEIEISSLGWGVGFQCMMVAYPHLETGAVVMTNTDLGVHQLKGLIGEIYRSLT